jgi:hypothetical protein
VSETPDYCAIYEAAYLEAAKRIAMQGPLHLAGLLAVALEARHIGQREGLRRAADNLRREAEIDEMVSAERAAVPVPADGAITPKSGEALT